MDLNHLFDLSLDLRRDETALEWQGRSYTFGEVAVRARRAARVLHSRGLRQGDRLCVQLANCIELIDLYLACVRLGVIFVPINVLYREREVEHILTDAAPRWFVTRETLDEFAAASQADVAHDFSAAPQLDGDSPAVLVYTSGTTGTSKGAILTHNNLAANAVNLVACWQITTADRLLLSQPLFHVHALGNGLHCWLLSGCRMRLLERFEHHKAAAEFLDFQPSLFFGVPTIYTRLLETAPEIAREIGRHMRLFVSGSAPLPSQVLDDFRALFGHTILERYGMTETLMNISNPYAGERRQGSIGFPLPGVSVRLLEAGGQPVAQGETGEICLKGPNIFPGYWKNAEASQAAFRDGWFRTGDLATVSADGYYTINGRLSDLIICGGFNVYPREIEEFLMEQPEVAEAAVAGAADGLKGEVPIAWIVARSDFDASVLAARCRSKLASFKVPRAFVQVDALPRNALGKVQKHALPRPEPARRT